MSAFDGLMDDLSDLLDQTVEIGKPATIRTAGKADREGAFAARATMQGSVQPATNERRRSVIDSGIRLNSALYTAFIPFLEIGDGELLRVNGELYTLVTPPSPLGAGGQGSHLELDVVRRRGNG